MKIAATPWIPLVFSGLEISRDFCGHIFQIAARECKSFQFSEVLFCYQREWPFVVIYNTPVMPGGLLVEEPGELDHILISLVDGGWWGLNVDDAHLEN